METTKKLTPRQYHLYIYLKKQYALDPKHFVTKKQICDALPNDYEYDADKRKRTCRSIEQDINALRMNEIIYKVIVSNHYGYKIANEEEANEWLSIVKSAALEKLKMYWKNRKSAESNNQMRIVFNKEKNCIEVF